jgi:glucosamine kinase
VDQGAPGAPQSVPKMGTHYLIGIDGGGTGTRARLAARDGRVLANAGAGASGLSLGVDAAWEQIRTAIDRAFAAANLPPAAPSDCTLGLGLAGANFAAQATRFLEKAGAYARVALETDGGAMLLGAFGGRPGVVVLAGTGSAGDALRADGTRVSVGGWGFPVGDEGGGAWLGMGAVRLAQCTLDGRAPRSALSGAILREIGRSPEDMLAWCAKASQGSYARLAPLVFEAGEADRAAVLLIDGAAQALIDMAHALDPTRSLPVAVSGSIGRRLLPRLSQSLGSRLVDAEGDAMDGALLLAQRAIERGAHADAAGGGHGR